MRNHFNTAMIFSGLTFTLFAQADHNTDELLENTVKNNKSRIEQVTVIGHQATVDATLGGVELVKLPLSAFVVSRDEIERIRFVDPDDFLDRIPGETQVRNLRIPNGGKPYTIPLVDGMPLDNPYDGATTRINSVNSFDIERIEIIKGPASALYGNNAFGGVINVVTRSIPIERQSRIFVEAGDFGHARAGINTGGAINDELGYFVDVNVLKSDGLRDKYLPANPNNFPDAVKNNRDAFSSKLRYRPTQGTDITVRYEYLEREEAIPTDIPQSAYDRDPSLVLSNRSGNPDVSFETVESHSFYLKAEQYFDTGLLNFSSVARNTDAQGDGRFSDPQIEEHNNLNTKLWYRQDLSNATLTIGGERFKGKTNADIYDGSDLGFAGSIVDNTDTELSLNALFAQYIINASDKVDITLGLRHEDIKASSAIGSAEFDDVSPKFGISFQANNSNMLWLGVSEGFYAPSEEDLFDPNEGDPNLKPEEATNIEFGLRGSKNHWAYNTSIYHTQIKNYLFTQEVDINGTIREQTSNAAQVTVEGIETVLEYTPRDDWRIGLTHTYANNVFDSFVQSTPGASDDFSGNLLSRSPKHHFNSRIAWLPIKDLIIELEGDFYSGYTTSDANDDPLGKFERNERFDLRINYKIGDWTVWLNGINLTDTLEDRVSYSSRRNERSYRLVNGRSFQIGASLQF